MNTGNNNNKARNPKRVRKAGRNAGLKKPIPPPMGQRKKLGQSSVAAAYATGQSSTAPDIRATRESCRVVHRELVASITGEATTAFSVDTALALNPGLAASFPWLSSIAVNWEQYHFNKLKACYYTRCSSATAGSVIIAPDYDAADFPPTTELVVSTYMDAAEDAPWKDIHCILKESAMHAMGSRKYVRNVAVAANQDIKTYDVGNLYACTVDSAAAAGWGKLWLEYDCTFYSPQINPQGNTAQFIHISGVTPTSASLLGTQTTVSASAVNPASVSGEIVTFLTAGTYLVNYYANAATSVTIASVPTVGAGGALITTYGNGNGYVDSGSTTTAVLQSVLMSAIVNSTLTLDNTIVGGTTAQIIITQLPSAAI